VAELRRGKTDLDLVEPGERFHDLFDRRALLVDAVLAGDMAPVLGGALDHMREHQTCSVAA
jgi:hypothetical protein